jgi:phosphoribosylaminoimidazole (AIR) synthetase
LLENVPKWQKKALNTFNIASGLLLIAKKKAKNKLIKTNRKQILPNLLYLENIIS